MNMMLSRGMICERVRLARHTSTGLACGSSEYQTRLPPLPAYPLIYERLLRCSLRVRILRYRPSKRFSISDQCIFSASCHWTLLEEDTNERLLDVIIQLTGRVGVWALVAFLRGEGYECKTCHFNIPLVDGVQRTVALFRILVTHREVDDTAGSTAHFNYHICSMPRATILSSRCPLDIGQSGSTRTQYIDGPFLQLQRKKLIRRYL